MQKAPPILEVRGLVKTFPGVRALDNVDFNLCPGEVHAVVGENGAGKSTLMLTLGGVHQPDSGELSIDRLPVVFRNPHEAAAAGIGVVFQERSLSLNLSVAENIFANRQPLRRRMLNLIDWDALYADARKLLSRFRLEIDPAAPVGQFPAATQQLIEILKAISLKPRILILDEPTSSLTTAESELLFDNIARLKSEGMSFIYISHHLREILRLADRITILRDGRHVHTCSAGELDEEGIVTRMVGRKLADLYGRRTHELGNERLRVESATRGRDFADVSFTARAGEIVGVAGLAGAGRTELGRGIFGAEPIDSGRVFVDGVETRIESPGKAISHGIGYLTEDRKEQGLFLDMSIRDNCIAASLGRFAGGCGLMDAAAVERFGEMCIERFNIVTPGLSQRVLNLSGGNQQKVLLSLWLAIGPKVLIVDEPTRGVDVGARSEIYRRLRELAASGVAILMISSDLPEVLGLSDRILVMRQGRLAAQIDSAQASEQRIIAAASGVEVSAAA